MTKNQSNIERVIRSIIGLVLLVLTIYFTGIVQIILAVAGAVLLATGIIGFCPLYKVFKINRQK